MASTLNVTLVRSVIGRIEAHKATVRGLGLRRMHHTVTVEDTPAIRGMINQVGYLLRVVEGQAVELAKSAKVSKKVASKQVASTGASVLPKKYLTKSGEDNLTAIEGVGPKISELLQAANINTFAQLSKAKVEDISEILKAAGSRYAMANPSTWPEQAALLAAGQVEQFEQLIAELDGGVRK